MFNLLFFEQPKLIEKQDRRTRIIVIEIKFNGIYDKFNGVFILEALSKLVPRRIFVLPRVAN